MEKCISFRRIALAILYIVSYQILSWGQTSFTFTQPVGSNPFSIGGSATGGKQIAVKDYNNDGYPDVVITNEAGTNDRAVLKLSTGTGGFSSDGLYPIGGSFVAQAVVTEDFDQDGYLDLIVSDNTVNPTAVSIKYFKGNAYSPAGSIFSSTASFSRNLNLTSPTRSSEQGANFLATADFNNDGLLDIATTAFDIGDDFYIVTILNDGSASPFQTPALNYSSYGTGLTGIGKHLAFGFFNADDYIDLVVIDDENVYFKQGNGDGTFGTTSTIASVNAGEKIRYIVIDDFNADGNEDVAALVQANNPNQDYIAFVPGNGDGTFGTKVTKNIALDAGVRHMALADMNNDGKNDLVVAAITTSQIYIIENINNTFTGFQTLAPADLGVLNFLPVWAAIDDFNADGLLDIVAVKSSGDEGRLFLNTTATIPLLTTESWGVEFDGSGQHGKSGLALPFPTAASKDNFTIELWVKPFENISDDQVILYHGDADSMEGFGLVIPQGKNEFNIIVNGNISSSVLAVGSPVNYGNWDHIAFGRSAGEWFIYKNGKREGTTGITTNFNASTPDKYTYLATLSGSDYLAKGAIKELRFWRKALTPATIREWISIELDGKHPNLPFLVSHFEFDEGQDDIAYNSARKLNPNARNVNISFPNGISWTDNLPPFGDKGSSDDFDVSLNPNNVDLLNTTGVKIDFDNASHPGGKIIVSRLLDKPRATHTIPGIKSQVSWVIRNFGPNATFTAADECEIEIKAFQFGFPGTIGTAPYNNPNEFKLYKRPSNSTNPTDWVLVHEGKSFGSIRFSGSPGTGISDFSEFIISYEGIALYIALQAFEGKRIEADKVQLRWQVAQEINSRGFEIEKSYDVKDFFKIGYQPARGNANLVHIYEFVDTEAEEPAYYRLKMIDNDGKTQYSEIVYVGKKGQETKLMIFPNPATDRVEIQMSKRFAYFSKLRMVVTSAQGQKMFEAEDRLLDLQMKLNEQFLKWASGVYILTIYDEQGAHSAKFIKK